VLGGFGGVGGFFWGGLGVVLGGRLCVLAVWRRFFGGGGEGLLVGGFLGKKPYRKKEKKVILTHPVGGNSRSPGNGARA